MAGLEDDARDDADQGEAATRGGGKPAAGGGAAADAPPGKKADKRKQTVIVIASIVGVIIAYISYKASKANAAAASTSNGLAPGTSSLPQTYGNVVGANGGSGSATTPTTPTDPNATGSASDGFTLLLQNLSDEIGQLEANVSTLPTSIGSQVGQQISASQTASQAQPPASSPTGFLFGSKASGASYVRNTAGKEAGAIEQVNPNSGALYWLDASQYAALGSPKYTNYADPNQNIDVSTHAVTG